MGLARPILETLAEREPRLWPADAALRARSISAEMHAGFPHLRQHMSMNIRKRHPGQEVELPAACRAYAEAVLALPALQEWMRDAERETESLPQFEQYA